MADNQTVKLEPDRDIRTGGLLFAEERQRAIVEQLRQRGKVTVEAMTVAFGVSPPTIRADLTRLEEQGLLRRTHGGAIAVGTTLYEPPYAERAVLRQPEKRAIADAAAGLVQEGETLLLDAGTTCHEIALLLRGFRRLTVVTNSLASANALSENDGIEVVLIGGTLQPRRRATLGALAARFLEPIQCDRAFVGVSGVHPTAGLTVVDFDAAQIKRTMLEKGKQAVVVADCGKVGQASFACIGPIAMAHLLITDDGVAAEDRAALEAAGVRVVVGGLNHPLR
ncbi:MAG TPA: DeoR/GlpR family DNA-binding transcription regulator [Chthonomonadaceae bacterium]|nr:DeoR/GlpR family DNA-binding transcription regulator [Chthonomonadaceae bacterium]